MTQPAMRPSEIIEAVGPVMGRWVQSLLYAGVLARDIRDNRASCPIRWAADISSHIESVLRDLEILARERQVAPTEDELHAEVEHVMGVRS